MEFGKMRRSRLLGSWLGSWLSTNNTGNAQKRFIQVANDTSENEAQSSYEKFKWKHLEAAKDTHMRSEKDIQVEHINPYPLALFLLDFRTTNLGGMDS